MPTFRSLPNSAGCSRCALRKPAGLILHPHLGNDNAAAEYHRSAKPECRPESEFPNFRRARTDARCALRSRAARIAGIAARKIPEKNRVIEVSGTKERASCPATWRCSADIRTGARTDHSECRAIRHARKAPGDRGHASAGAGPGHCPARKNQDSNLRLTK